MFRFRLDIGGEVALDRGIGRFSDGVTDYRPIWPVIEDDYYAQVKDQFQTEGEAGGEKWAELSAEYAGWKAVAFPGQPILQRTGDLYRSMTEPNDPNGVRVELRKTLTLGSRLAYAKFHQTGTRMMPARPEVVFDEAFKRSVMHHLHAYLVQVATQSGFRTGLTPIETSKLGAAFGRGVAGGTLPVQAGGRTYSR